MPSEETIRRANEARQLLANPLLIEAFERVEKEAFEQALMHKDHPAESARWLLAVEVIRDVWGGLEDLITEGEMAVRPRPTAA